MLVMVHKYKFRLAVGSLSSPSSRYIRINGLSAEENAYELIDDVTKQWRRELIINCFSHFEPQQIVNIPLYWRLREDRLIWHWERNGKYSVKSAFRILQEDNNRNTLESSCPTSKPLWKAIWKVVAPNCVKNFLWRVEKDILPTRGRLERKGLRIDTICLICCSEKETPNHLFMHCQLSQFL